MLFQLPVNGEESNFSQKYSNALALTYTFDVNKEDLQITITNTSKKHVTFNKPILAPAGNIYIRNKTSLKNYPHRGSSQYVKQSIALAKNQKTSFSYKIPKEDFLINNEDQVEIKVYIDDLNGEKKRTPFMATRRPSKN